MSNRPSEIRYLREKAQQFRDMAMKHKTLFSSRLLEIAVEFEARADELDSAD